ncbi:EAL domain-containing protein [Cognatiluteimonas profundi]|uniref:EAL domain-containing protein n=1 Tax=Cognatiluteimonas profundi TaxID=2594501 RepID=UPI00131DCDB1|nr:EAL domain-containing protein [Lysobacter profundi]
MSAFAKLVACWRRPGIALACVLGTLAAASLAPQSSAAVRDYYFEQAGGNDGLAQKSVTALAQDPDGFIWIGTQGGLHRFDGQRYTLYRENPHDPDSIPDSFITALSGDGERGLWIGTYSRYVARLDLDTGHVRRFAAKGHGNNGRQVFAMVASPREVWIGTVDGLDRLDPATGQQTRILSLPSSLLAGKSQALMRDAQGTLWYGTAAGLYRLDRGATTAAQLSPALPVDALLRDRSGRIWAGGRSGLYLVTDRRTLVQAWPRAANDAEPRDVRALSESPDGRVWMAISAAGLRRFDPTTGRTTSLRQDDTLPASLPEDGINALLVDKAGLLWVGGQLHGAAVADSRGARFPYLVDRELATTTQGNSIRAVHQSDDGRLWLASDDGRLLRYDSASGFDDYSAILQVGAQASTSPTRVMAFADSNDGLFWMATSAGLFQLDPHTPSVHAIAVPGIGQPSLRSVAVGPDGSLWLGSSDVGLIRFRPASPGRAALVQHIPFLDGNAHGLAHPTVHALLVDAMGRVWIGTGHGLDRLDPRTGRLSHFQQQADGTGLAGNLVRALWQDANGTIWVGSHGGLNRIDDPDGVVRFTQPLETAMAGQPMPLVFSLVADTAGSLWLGTDRGLLRFNPRSGALRQYGLSDGLQDLEFNGGAAAMLRDGRLAFGGVNGLNVFDPAQTLDSRWEPPLRLLSAHVGASADDASPPRASGGLEFAESAGILRLRIGALDYLGNSRIRYRYRIDGVDTDWIDNGNRSEITYTLLPAGRYTFRAQSTNHDGVWNTRELRLPITVEPPWWRSPLALAGYVLLASLLLIVLWLRLQQRARKDRDYFSRIRDREERLKLALWASGEQFWDYDLVRDELQRTRVKDDVASTAAIAVETDIEVDHQIHPDDLQQVREHLRRHLRGDSPLFLSEHRIQDDNGEWIWTRARGRVVERAPDGRARRIAGTARNITDNRDAERERRIAAQVLRSMSEAVSVLDRHFHFVSVNPAFCRMTGYDDGEIIGRNGSLLDSSQHDLDFYRDIRHQLQQHGRWSGEMWQQRKDGEEFLCAYECSSVLDSSGEHTLYVMVLSDITDQKRAEQELRYLANFDTLTNLPNRTLLSERLSRAIVRARRQNSYIAVLFLDLDRFKDINDSLGHAAGDRILRAAAVRLQDTVGAQHTVARLGGDEFTVVLENLKSPEQAEKAAREIIMAFGAPLLLDDRQEVSISTSIGISVYPDNAQVPTELLKQADTAMYQAKAAGRRTYLRYIDSMDVTIRRRATLSGALRKVLDRGELRMVYQPRLALAQNRIVGVEALLRWRSEEHGDISPTQFIPLAEESGLILEIGEWVLRESCLTLRRWHQHGLEGLAMSINVSVLQLLRGDFPGVVERVLAETQLPPSSIELELTESVVMANAEQTADTLRALRHLGVSLAIDDFGTGYSSLSYLKRLPINTLKIDKEFVDDLTLGSDDAAITTTIIAMARSLGLNVVAEGVETEAQMRFLREHLCDEIQGFWLSPPLEAHRCLAFIRNWAPSGATAPA